MNSEKVKEYKRLTVRHPNSDYIAITETKQLQETRESKIVLNRLAELEDKIEDGTLIELPCKVGDIVYQFDNGGEIYELMILHINIYKGKPYYETDAIDFDNRAIGESIFLTKAEAEARLKELQEQGDAK